MSARSVCWRETCRYVYDDWLGEATGEALFSSPAKQCSSGTRGTPSSGSRLNFAAAFELAIPEDEVQFLVPGSQFWLQDILRLGSLPSNHSPVRRTRRHCFLYGCAITEDDSSS
jgi:hypothetical protein